MIISQNWLRMPSRAYVDGPNGIPVGGATLFRKGKRLPHPQTALDPYHSTVGVQQRGLSIDTEVPSVSESDSSSPHTLKHASKRIGAPGLPPTPPTHTRESSGRQQPNKGLSSGNSPAPGTPTHNSPPTPDVTPPRAMPPLAFRPPVNDRFPSSASRTDSFKTARESQYSSDEEDAVSTVRSGLPSAQPLGSETSRQPVKGHKKREVGLGLGLESEGTTTPRPNQDSHPEFVVFDGEWGSAGEEVSEVEREWDDNLMRNVIVRKRPGRQLHLFTNSPTAEVVENDIVSPTNATKVVRGLPLQERIARRHLERDATRRSEGQNLRLETVSPMTPDIRRFSAMSGRSVSSTIIEAMVVDGPPTRRKTLRHSKRQLGLRDISSDQSTRSSAPNSIVSSESQQMLSHKRSRIPEKSQKSLKSNTTVSTASLNGKSRREVINNGGIPVVVIPARRSSSKSSKAPSLRSTSSRKSKRSNSLGSAPLSQSSKFNEPGYFENPSRKRTMSESAGSGRSIHTIDFPPKIPARRSSLSAPTSRNTSRAGSLTTESLKAHNLIHEKAQVMPKPDVVQSAGSHSEMTQNTRPHVDHNGDPFFGTRLSTQVTPFSQASYETAGTAAEVSEAMAVSLFPHQNKSVLIVQQQAAPAQASRPVARPKLETGQPMISINGNKVPVTPPQPVHPMDEVDSPLRNPRAPPEPPAIKFIPPTPAALLPGQEEDRQLGFETQPATPESKPTRGLSLMRRALSNRHRNSESAVQGGGLMKRTFSLSGRRKGLSDESATRAVANPSTLYPSVEDRPADSSKLHPFWRPAHFWDDLEDHDDSGDDDEFGRYPIIDNRPNPPSRSLSGKLKRTFAILPIKDSEDSYRRYYTTEKRSIKRTPSGNMRVVKRRSTPTLGRTPTHRARDVPVEERFGYGFKEGNGGKKFHTIPGIGIRVEYVGWQGMKRRISEKRREERSEKLRASISTPRSVRSGVDDVLRRRE